MEEVTWDSMVVVVGTVTSDVGATCEGGIANTINHRRMGGEAVLA
jgi:hypothetical protein